MSHSVLALDVESVPKEKENIIETKIEDYIEKIDQISKVNPVEIRQEISQKNESEHKENKKPKSLSSSDVQTLIIMLNQLLDNLN